MEVTFNPCVTDEDFAKVSLFLLERKFDLHPSYTTLQMVALLYSYITEGSLHHGALPDGRVIGAAAYYHGTPGRGFTDKDVALIDIVILDQSYRGTRFFLYSLEYMIDWIQNRHPEVQEVRFTALSENAYLCKLYSKFSAFAYKQEGNTGEETVFSENITKIGVTLARYRRV